MDNMTFYIENSIESPRKNRLEQKRKFCNVVGNKNNATKSTVLLNISNNLELKQFIIKIKIKCRRTLKIYVLKKCAYECSLIVATFVIAKLETTQLTSKLY